MHDVVIMNALGVQHGSTTELGAEVEEGAELNSRMTTTLTTPTGVIRRHVGTTTSRTPPQSEHHYHHHVR